MDNKKLKQLVKEALSNMVDEDTVDPGTEDLEDALEDPKMGGAFNELLKPASDISDTGNDPTGVSSDADDHFQNVEEMDMGGDSDADELADLIITMEEADLEEETLSLREFFDLDEMARKAQSYKLTDRLTNAGSFLQRVNDRIKAKTMGAGGRGRKAKEFTEEDITNMLDVLGQGTFTSQDIVSAIGRFDKVQPVNAILAKMRDKGYIDYAEDLKKSAEPDTSAEPKRRGRPAAPKPEDEFDAPEMAPELAPDDDPVVQQATQAQAQAQDPKKQKVKAFMDQMKAMGIISDTNKVLDMDTYKAEFAKFKSTLQEGFRDPEDNYGFGDVKYEITDYAIGDEVIVVKGGERIEINKKTEPKPRKGPHSKIDYPTPNMKGTVKEVDKFNDRIFVNFPNMKGIEKYWEFMFEPGEVVFPGDEEKIEYDDDFTDEDYDKWDAENLAENKSKKSKKGLLTERFQQLAGIKSLYAINSLKEDHSSEYKEGDRVKFNPEKMMEFEFEDEMEYYNDLTGVITNIGAGELEIKLSKPIQPPGGADPGLTSINLFQEEGDFSMISKL